LTLRSTGAGLAPEPEGLPAVPVWVLPPVPLPPAPLPPVPLPPLPIEPGALEGGLAEDEADAEADAEAEGEPEEAPVAEGAAEGSAVAVVGAEGASVAEGVAVGFAVALIGGGVGLLGGSRVMKYAPTAAAARAPRITRILPLPLFCSGAGSSGGGAERGFFSAAFSTAFASAALDSDFFSDFDSAGGGSLVGRASAAGFSSFSAADSTTGALISGSSFFGVGSPLGVVVMDESSLGALANSSFCERSSSVPRESLRASWSSSAAWRMTVRSAGGGRSAGAEVEGKKEASLAAAAACTACCSSGGTIEPRPTIVALRPPAGAVGAAAAVAGASAAAGTSSKADEPPSPLVWMRRSMIWREDSSSLMNLTPMPLGGSPVAPGASRFQTTRPTPWSTCLSSAILISNLSRVPGGKGEGVLMKMPPRLMSYE
jgi:hypothetical protein